MSRKKQKFAIKLPEVGVKFYSKSLGTITIKFSWTYEKQKEITPDLIPVPEYGLFFDFFKYFEDIRNL